MDDLAEWISRAKSLDAQAFDVLIERYSARLYGFLYRLTGQREDTEDLVQEVFVRVVRTISEFEQVGHFDAWIFRIAMNLVRDRARKSKASQKIPLAEWARGQDKEVRDPEKKLEFVEESEKLQAALNELPDLDREVIMLRHYGQLSFPRIAEILKTPTGTLMARAHRALGKLRAALESPT